MKERFITYQVVAAYATAMWPIVSVDMTSEDAKDVLETIEYLKGNLLDWTTDTQHHLLDKAALFARDLCSHFKAREDEEGGDYSKYIKDQVKNLRNQLAKIANFV